MPASIFIIATTKSNRAYDSAVHLLKLQKVSASRRDGVEPDNIRMLPEESVGSQLPSYRAHGHRLARAEKARYLSHYRLLKHALSDSTQRIVVLEPNFLPSPHFKQIVSELDKLDQSYEFVNLAMPTIPFAVRKEHYDWLQPLTPSHTLAPALDGLPATSAYSLSLQGLRKIVPRLMNIQADLATTLASMHWNGTLRAFQTWPQAVFPNPFANTPWPPAQYPAAIRAIRNPAGIMLQGLAKALSGWSDNSQRKRIKAFQSQSQHNGPDTQ